MFTALHEAWLFLTEHPIFSAGNLNFFNDLLDIDCYKVNPKTNEEDDDETKNTETVVRLECSVFEKDKNKEKREKSLTSNKTIDTCHYHDIDLDCGDKTFEKAIIKLANLVLKKYGNEQIVYTPATDEEIKRFTDGSEIMKIK